MGLIERTVSSRTNRLLRAMGPFVAHASCTVNTFVSFVVRERW